MAEGGELGRIVDVLVTTLETNFRGFTISEIVKGGSLGHGTAVPGDYDIDLVIYSRDIKGRDVIGEGDKLFTKWLDMLDDFLQGHFRAAYERTNKTKRSVQFNFKQRIDVDLLVSPYYESSHDFFTFLRSIQSSKRDTFTVCACKWQVDFFKRIPPQVKEYIKKAKKWRNDTWSREGSGEGRPSSYLMSLLVVAAYERNPDNVSQGLQDIVHQGDSLDVCWPGHCYKMSDYPSLLPSRPRIVDPANPANNVWTSGFKPFNKNKPCDYEPGNGNNSKLRKEIGTIVL